MEKKPHKPYWKHRLFCPGPTPTPLDVQLAAIGDTQYHRNQDFYTRFLNCRYLLRNIIHSKNLPIILSCSGTGAMEAVVANLTDVGDRVLIISAGKFGERWTDACQAYGCQTEIIQLKYGETLAKGEITRVLSGLKDIKAVFLQGTETSTGVTFSIKEIAEEIRNCSSAHIIIDAITYVLANEIKVDEWQIDGLVFASQKGFALPPGLSFVSLSDKAMSKFSQRNRFYFDLRREIKEQEKGSSAWTPSTTLITQLQVALEKIAAWNEKNYIAHHQILAESTRKAISAINLELFAKENPANSLTAVKIPPSLNTASIISSLKQNYGMTVAGGQNDLKGKIIRIAHLGFTDPFDIVALIGALEMTLLNHGHPLKIGEGCKAFLSHWHEKNQYKA